VLETWTALQRERRARLEAEVAGVAKDLEETTKKIAEAGTDLERIFEAGKDILGSFLYTTETGEVLVRNWGVRTGVLVRKELPEATSVRHHERNLRPAKEIRAAEKVDRMAQLLRDYRAAKSGDEVARDVRAALASAAERLEKRTHGFRTHPVLETWTALQRERRARLEAEVAGVAKDLEETTKKIAEAGTDLERIFEAGKELLGEYLHKKANLEDEFNGRRTQADASSKQPSLTGRYQQHQAEQVKKADRVAQLLRDYRAAANSGDEVARDVRAALASAANVLEKRMVGIQKHPLPEKATADQHYCRSRLEAETARLSKALEETTKKVAEAGTGNIRRIFEAGKEVLGEYLYSKAEAREKQLRFSSLRSADNGRRPGTRDGRVGGRDDGYCDNGRRRNGRGGGDRGERRDHNDDYVNISYYDPTTDYSSRARASSHYVDVYPPRRERNPRHQSYYNTQAPQREEKRRARIYV